MRLRGFVRAVAGERHSRLRSAVTERDELVGPWDPGFYRKVLRCAHTGVAPHAAAQSVGAPLVWSAEADSLQEGR